MKLKSCLSFLLIVLNFIVTAQEAPDFTIVTTDNQTINLYDDFLNQGKSVVIELFFVDCPPCRTFAPFMSNLHKKMVNQEIGVEFISLSVIPNDNDETVNEFKRMFEHDWHFAHSGGKSFEAAEPYQNGTYGTYFGTPTIVVIAPDGTVNYIRRVFSDNNAYIENIETAIIESQTAFNDNAPTTAIINGGINTIAGTGLSGVEIKLTGATDTTIISDENGNFQSSNLLADEDYTVSLTKNTNAVNGVTTLDIVLISKHILGIDPFTTNYQQIAADVNRSGSITTFDLVQMRQLILGISDNFPNAPSWVFDPNELNISALDELSTLSFTGIKMGDLNESAKPNDLLGATERKELAALVLSTKDQKFKVGETVQLTINAENLQNIKGYQFSLVFDEQILALNEVEESDLHQLYGGHFNLALKEKGVLSTSWYTENKQFDNLLFTLPFTAKRAGILSEAIAINATLTEMEAFDFEEELLDIKLNFEPIEEMPKFEISLFPNPSENTDVSLIFESARSENILLTIVNLTGQVINQSFHEVTIGQQTINLATANWPAGIYILKLANERKLFQSIRMIKG